MSFFTWIYNQGTYGPILNYETDVNKWGLHVFIHSPSIFYAALNTRDNANDFSVVKIEDTIAKNAWTFVGFTYDYNAGKVRLYIDGILKKEADSPKNELNTNFKIQIGGTKYGHSADKAFPGRLSCLQIYNVALTNAQVKYIQRYCRDVLDIFKPCVNHTSIDVPDRQLTKKEGTRPTDKTTVDFTQWYRLKGKKILSSCPTSSSCGTQTPGWLNGQYPSQEDGIKTMELCYRKDSDCCASKVSVLVRQCYGHYVFKFHDFPVEGRFCTETDPETFADIIFMSTNERCLINHVFYTVDDVKDMSTCVSYCLNAGSRCKSVDYIKEGSGRCQLNNSTKSEGHLREDSKCTHYEVISY
ncbi:uromodulin-like [Exaiptasia diaphana]|uniref:Apple domain-containing protein n=1 Tax=Exaiptasia diaphana TaxID=2652724 RepID=A0A913YVR9_EXADI|nr:uromodulin-like [Exaiptasia diaphana]